VIAKGPLIRRAAQAINSKGLKNIGFEKERLAYGDWEMLKQLLPLRAELKAVEPLIEKQRMVKSAQEIDCIRRAVHTKSAAFDAAVKRIRPGIAETDLDTQALSDRGPRW
jgi:Xaa-Pro aminopeptidase